MAHLISHHVFRRQSNIDDDPNDLNDCPWEYCSETGYIVKWVIVAVIFVLILIFVVGGYWHAQRRMKRGLAPLRYHRWLISRHAQERFFPTRPQNSAAFYRPTYVPGGNGRPQEYQMNNYGYVPPPPAYHESENAPVYTPPSKVNPDQVYGPPPGSPPTQILATASSSSGPSHPPRVTSPVWEQQVRPK